MIIEKEVFDKINIVNKNLHKLSKYKSSQNPYAIDSMGSDLINTLVNDLAYVVGKLNETYKTFSTIVSQQIQQKD